jgi:hypothetical protein
MSAWTLCSGLASSTCAASQALIIDRRPSCWATSTASA